MIAKILKCVLLLALVAVAVADSTLLARSMLYSGDEIFNLDTILTFFAKGDYTTTHLGGYPFDPVISSGVLAMWPVGLVMAIGGNLYEARLFTIFLLLVLTVALAFWTARRMGLDAMDAALFAFALWDSLQFVGNHDMRVSNPGELWGFLYLAAGILLVDRHPRAAAFTWGLATWHCKVIYLPFGAALVAATAIARARERDAPPLGSTMLRDFAALALAFLAPLLAWMLLIWLRYDTRTVLAWLVAYIVFVVRHGIGVSLAIRLPHPFEGWRFEPNWAPPPLFLTYRYYITLPTLVPLLAGPLALVPWLWLRGRSPVPPRPLEVACLFATLSSVALFSAWFFTGYDETQWQRHVLPAIYVSIAVAAYCVLDIARVVRAPRVLGYAAGALACVGVLWACANRTAALAETRGWQTSYAAACHGTNVLAAPCKQEAATQKIAELTTEICGITDRPRDQDCTVRNRKRFLERASAFAAAHAADPESLYTAAYVIVFVQSWAYFDEDEFNRDLGRHLCSLDNPILWSYFEQARADVRAMRRECHATRPA